MSLNNNNYRAIAASLHIAHHASHTLLKPLRHLLGQSLLICEATRALTQNSMSLSLMKDAPRFLQESRHPDTVGYAEHAFLHRNLILLGREVTVEVKQPFTHTSIFITGKSRPS